MKQNMVTLMDVDNTVTAKVQVINLKNTECKMNIVAMIKKDVINLRPLEKLEDISNLY